MRWRWRSRRSALRMARISLCDPGDFDRNLCRPARPRLRRARPLGGAPADAAAGRPRIPAQRRRDPLARPVPARMRDIGAARLGPVQQGAGAHARHLAQHGEDPCRPGLREARRANRVQAIEKARWLALFPNRGWAMSAQITHSGDSRDARPVCFMPAPTHQAGSKTHEICAHLRPRCRAWSSAAMLAGIIAFAAGAASSPRSGSAIWSCWSR